MKSGEIDPRGMDFEDAFPAIACVEGRWPGRTGRLEKARARYRAFADRHVRPIALEVDREGGRDPEYLNREFTRRAAEQGMFSIVIPKLFGGQGGGLMEMAIMIEELCAACTGLGNVVGAHYLGYSGVAAGMNLRLLGAVSEDIVAGEKRGEAVILSAAHTEPQAGSDVEDEEHMPGARVGTTARRTSGGYVLNGQKIFISDGHLATWHMVTAWRDRKDPLRSGLLAVVRTGQQGFQIVSHERKMGQRACPASFLVLEECFVSDEHVVTDRMVFFERVLFVLGASRVGVAAIGTGCARGAYEAALEIARTERRSGRCLIDEQWVRQILAEMLANVMVARSMYVTAGLCEARHGMMSVMSHPFIAGLQAVVPPSVFRMAPVQACIRSETMSRILNTALTRIDIRRRQRAQAHSSAAKFVATDLAMQNANLAMEIAGAAGLAQHSGIEKIFRDAKLLQIYEGTNQINRKHLWDSMIARTTTL